jgi:hypothetical protein
MFRPSTINLGRLFITESQFTLTFGIGEARPQRHREFDAVVSRKFQKLRERAGFHVVILA